MSNAPGDPARHDQVLCLLCPPRHGLHGLHWFSDIHRLNEHIKRTHGLDRLCPKCPHVFKAGLSCKDLDIYKKAHESECRSRDATLREVQLRQYCLFPWVDANYRTWREYKTHPAIDGPLFNSFRAIFASLGILLPTGDNLRSYLRARREPGAVVLPLAETANHNHVDLVDGANNRGPLGHLSLTLQGSLAEEVCLHLAFNNPAGPHPAAAAGSWLDNHPMAPSPRKLSLACSVSYPGPHLADPILPAHSPVGVRPSDATPHCEPGCPCAVLHVTAGTMSCHPAFLLRLPPAAAYRIIAHLTLSAGGSPASGIVVVDGGVVTIEPYYPDGNHYYYAAAPHETLFVVKGSGTPLALELEPAPTWDEATLTDGMAELGMEGIVVEEGDDNINLLAMHGF